MNSYVGSNVNNYLDDLIPCEICNNIIPFNDYITHLDNCVLNRRVTNYNYSLNNINNPLIRPVRIRRSLGIIGDTLHSTRLINNQPESRLLFNIRPIATTRATSNINHLENNLSMFRNTDNSRLPMIRPVIPVNLNNSIMQLLRDQLDNNTNNLDLIEAEIANNPDSMNLDDNYTFDNIISSLINMPVQNLDTYFNDTLNDDFNELNNLEDVNVCISDINTVTKIIDYDNIEHKDNDCIICTDKYENAFNLAQSNNLNKTFRITLCKHIFCDECITRWLSLSKKCALCNVNLEDLAIKHKNENNNLTNDNENIIIDENELDNKSSSNNSNSSNNNSIIDTESENECCNNDENTYESIDENNDEIFIEGDDEAYEM
jgi:hypothetical protein